MPVQAESLASRGGETPRRTGGSTCRRFPPSHSRGCRPRLCGRHRLGLANQFERLLRRSGRIVELAVGVEPFELATRPDSPTVRPSRRAAGCRRRDPGAGGRDCRNRAALDRDVYAAGAAREPRVGDYRHNCLYLPSCIRSEGHGRMWQKHRTYPFAPRLLGRLHQSPSPYPPNCVASPSTSRLNRLPSVHASLL